jgi:hypothetical protein
VTVLVMHVPAADAGGGGSPDLRRDQR